MSAKWRRVGSASDPGLHEYEHLPCKGLTDTAEIRRVLEFFVERVRAGHSLDSDLLAFVADGVERHLAGKKAWPARRGTKRRSPLQTLLDALPLWHERERLFAQSADAAHKRGQATPAAQLIDDTITQAAEACGVSDDTMKRALKCVGEAQRTSEGRATIEAFRDLMAFEDHLRTSEGQAWLRTAKGRKWARESPATMRRLLAHD